MLVVLALAAWVLALTVGVRSVPTSKTDTWIRIAQVATLLATIASLLPVVGVSRSWSSDRWWWDRIWDVLLALAGVGFTWVVLFGNLLQWQLRY